MFSPLSVFVASTLLATFVSTRPPPRQYGAGSYDGVDAQLNRYYGPSRASFYGGPSDAVAVVHLPRADSITDSCDSGPIQCCNQLFEAHSENANALHRLLGVVVDPIAAQAGLSCVPISAVGVGAGGECDSQPVCCANNHMRGLVVVGCSPINVNT